MELWKSASSLIGRHKFKLEGIEHFSKKMIDEWNTKAKLKARKTDEWKYRRGKKIIYTHTQTRTKKYWMHMIFQCCRFLFDGFLSLMKSHLSRASTYFRESCSQRIQNMIISVNDCVHFFAFSSLSLGFSRRSDFRMSHSISFGRDSNGSFRPSAVSTMTRYYTTILWIVRVFYAVFALSFHIKNGSHPLILFGGCYEPHMCLHSIAYINPV